MGDLRPVWRWLALVLLVLLLLGCAYNGIYEGLRATSYADTPGMKVAMVTQILYGFFSLAALVALGAGKPWVLWPVLGAGIFSSATAGLAPVVYGGAPFGTGLLSGAASALLVGLIVWGWYRTRVP